MSQRASRTDRIFPADTSCKWQGRPWPVSGLGAPTAILCRRRRCRLPHEVHPHGHRIFSRRGKRIPWLGSSAPKMNRYPRAGCRDRQPRGCQWKYCHGTSSPKSPADGYTALMAINTALTTNPLLYKHLTYDLDRDLSSCHASGLCRACPGRQQQCARSRSFSELIALAKAKPGSINFSSTGDGHSAQHLAAETPEIPHGRRVPARPLQGRRRCSAGRAERRRAK